MYKWPSSLWADRQTDTPTPETVWGRPAVAPTLQRQRVGFPAHRPPGLSGENSYN